MENKKLLEVTSRNNTIIPVLNLAFALHRQGKFADSERMCTEYLEAARAAGETRTTPLLKLRFNLGVAQMMRKPAHRAAAERTFADLMKDGAEVLPEEHWMLFAFRTRFGMCRTDAGDEAIDDPDLRRRGYQEAQQALEPALAGLEKTLGANNRQTRESAGALVEVLQKLGNDEAAAALAERLQLGK